MLQLRNETAFAATIFASPDPDGVDTVYAVVKGTWDVTGDPSPTLAAEQRPIALEAEHYGDPTSSSLRFPSDVSLSKPGTDVLLVGHAWAPGGSARWMDVSLHAGPIRRTIRVFGDRRWSWSGLEWTASAPAPFQQMPLVWERAFGGLDRIGGRPHLCSENPVGVGYVAPKSEEAMEGRPLPNIEDPAHPTTSPSSQSPPIGFGPIEAHWAPRRSLCGTYDEQWQRERAPYLPKDFDPHFLQVAPPGSWVEPHLTGGEWIEVHGMTPSGVLGFQLPARRVVSTFLVRGVPRPVAADLDTVLIEPDDSRLVLVWRAALAVDKDLLQVGEVVVEEGSRKGGVEAP